MVFFVKQKTAYEMRISDWSSDVCSSDLGGGGRCRRPPLFLSARRAAAAGAAPGRPAGVRAHGPPDAADGRLAARVDGAAAVSCRRLVARDGAPRPRTARTSVVSGKSVSIRVDLGGRTILNKKNKRHLSHQITRLLIVI